MAEHQLHIPHVAHVPIANVCVKAKCSTKHTVHIGHVAHIPSAHAAITVECLCISKHSIHIGNQRKVWHIHNVTHQIGGTHKGTVHRGPLYITPLLDRLDFLSVLVEVKEDSWEISMDLNSISASFQIDMSSITSHSCNAGTISPFYQVVITATRSWYGDGLIGCGGSPSSYKVF